MTALSITASQVLLVSGDVEAGIAGEAFTAGASLYKADDGTWKKAQCDGTAVEAGANNNGIALGSADAATARVGVALPGAVVTLGAGAAPAAGSIYCMGRTAGALIPAADLASTDKVTVAALGAGTNRVRVARAYDAAAIVP